MKNTKSNFKAFSKLSPLLFILFPPTLCWAKEEFSCLRAKSWDEKISVYDYMKHCDGAIISMDGCRINLEQACVNGVEVNLRSRGNIRLAMEHLGFKTQPSRGLKRSDFADPSKMYHVSKTPGGGDLKLCSKVEGINLDSGLDLNNLPSDKSKSFEIESVPAIINPDSNVASFTFHWKLTVRNGRTFIEAEFREINSLDQSTGGANENSEKTKASGRDFEEVLDKFNLYNLVRCKKGDTFTDFKDIPTLRTLADSSNDQKQSLAAAHTKIMKGISNSGLNTVALTRRMSQILGMPIPEEPATPAHGKSHAKHPSHRRH